MAPLPTTDPSELEALAGTTPPTDTFDSLSTIEAVDLNLNPSQYPINVIAEEYFTRRLRIRLRAVGLVSAKILRTASGCILLFIGGLVYLVVALFLLIVIVFQPPVLIIIINLAFKAANGAIPFMIGNAILRGVLHAHYTTNTVAAAIGAVGGVVSAFIFGIVFACLPKDENGQLRWPFSLVWSVAVATLSGPIGFVILQKYHINCHDIDVLHAMGAGALGGIILGPGLSLVLAVLFSPLIIAVKLGFKWVYIRSNESWSDTGAHRFWYFYSYGGGEHDADIQEEVAQLERPRQNPQQYRPQVQQPYRAYGNSSSLL